MNPILKIFVLIVLVQGCESEGRIYLTGDADTRHARVYLDGQEVGTMEMGSDSIKATLMIVRAKNGPHQITVLSEDGRKFIKSIDLQGEDYLGVLLE